MARMRTIKPEAAMSETLAQVPRDVRWTFGMFWTHCDDEGRAVWNTRLIKAAIYPLDDDVTLDVIEHEFAALELVGAVCFYEVDGREYVHVPAFGEHQHPNRRVESKLPPCPETDHSAPTHAQRSEPAVQTHEGLTPVVVGEGRGDVDGEGRAHSAATALARIDGQPTAQTIVGEWIERCDKRPPATVVGQTAKVVDALLAEGIDPDDVRRGMRAWKAKGLHPSTLPAVVNEVMNAAPRGVLGRAQDETDAMFARAAQRLGVAQ